MRFLAGLAFCELAGYAAADAVLMKNGERYIGEVTDLGDSLRIKNAGHPEGLVVRKSDVKTVYPKPEVMIEKLRAELDRVKARYEAGKKAANPNAEMKAAMEMLFDPELEAEDAIQIYPDFRKQFQDVQTSIQELRKLCRDAQVSDKPGPAPPEEKPDPKPDPNADPGRKPDPAPAPANPDEVLLAAPQDAKPNDLFKAAKVMQERAVEHGYEGITTKVVRRGDFQVVQMVCKDGMTPDMRKRLIWYADKLGKRFEIRVAHALSPAEKEQFPAPTRKDAENGKAKAPKGMKWHFTHDGSPVLLAEKHVVTRKDLGKLQLSKEGAVYYEINRPIAAPLRADKAILDPNVCAGIYFLSDDEAWGTEGLRLAFEGEPGARTWLDTGCTEPYWKVIMNIFDHPLPFRMTEAK